MDSSKSTRVNYIRPTYLKSNNCIYGALFTTYTDPFDCYSDQCHHLNWLIRDNRQLLDKLSYAFCDYDHNAFVLISQSLCDGFGIGKPSASEKTISNMFFYLVIPVSVLFLGGLI